MHSVSSEHKFTEKKSKLRLRFFNCVTEFFTIYKKTYSSKNVVSVVIFDNIGLIWNFLGKLIWHFEVAYIKNGANRNLFFWNFVIKSCEISIRRYGFGSGSSQNLKHFKIFEISMKVFDFLTFLGNPTLSKISWIKLTSAMVFTKTRVFRFSKMADPSMSSLIFGGITATFIERVFGIAYFWVVSDWSSNTILVGLESARPASDSTFSLKNFV